MTATTLRPEHGVESPPRQSFELPSLISEILRKRAPQNIRKHWLRDAWRVTVLAGSDVSVFVLLRSLLGVVRGGLLGSDLAALSSAVFPQGFLGGWQFAVAILLSMLLVGAYGSGYRRREPHRVLSGVALAGLLVLFTSVWESPLADVAAQYAGTVAILGTTMVLSRSVVDAVVRRARSRYGGARSILVSHEGADWREIAKLVTPSREFLFVGSLRLTNGSRNGGRGDLLRLSEVIEQHRADTVLLWGDLNEDEFAIAVEVALASGCRLLAQPRAPASLGVEPKAVWLGGRPLVQLTRPSLQASELAAKRALDLMGSVFGLILLSPLFAIIALRIRADSPGSAFFRQERVGKGGRTFKVWKFRTMQSGVSEEVHRRFVVAQLKRHGERGVTETAVATSPKCYKLAGDTRITRVGEWLRSTSLDELPQLINVLRGEMSLVGPRPPIAYEVSEYEQWQLERLSVTPGMTGLWQVSGRSRMSYREMCEVDIEYVKRWSVWLDLKILFQTVPVVLFNLGRAA